MEKHRPDCSVEGCTSPAYTRSSGLCVMHYARMKKHGSTDDPRPQGVTARRTHPLWMRWTQLSRRRVLAPEWVEFWDFVAGVSPQPENTKKLARPDSAKPYAPANFVWLKTPTKEENLAYSRQWQKDNRPRVKDSQFRRQYGIGWEDYQRMLTEQGGVCAICGGAESRFVTAKTRKLRNLCVDHDHETNAVRGLLCGDCNVGLGAFKDNPTTILRAIGYLRQHARKRLRVVE